MNDLPPQYSAADSLDERTIDSATRVLFQRWLTKRLPPVFILAEAMDARNGNAHAVDRQLDCAAEARPTKMASFSTPNYNSMKAASWMRIRKLRSSFTGRNSKDNVRVEGNG
jgi:hypothetical protein